MRAVVLQVQFVHCDIRSVFLHVQFVHCGIRSVFLRVQFVHCGMRDVVLRVQFVHCGMHVLNKYSCQGSALFSTAQNNSYLILDRASFI